MKKLVLLTLLVLYMAILSGQSSIDRLFDRYEGQEGFTTVTLNGNLLNFAANFEDDGKDRDLEASITQIRILTQDNKTLKGENFYKIVVDDLDLDEYEEFIRVKESDQDMRMLVKTEGRKISEFLMIAGGDDNAVVQIKGNMKLSDAKRLSEMQGRLFH